MVRSAEYVQVVVLADVKVIHQYFFWTVVEKHEETGQNN